MSHFVHIYLLIAFSMILATSGTAISWYQRVAYQDIDPLYDDDSDQLETNMNNAVDYVVSLGANTVFLQAYADPTGHTRVSELYFANSLLGQRGTDIFPTLAAKFKAKNIRVGAWMPISAYQFSTINGTAAEYVQTWNSSTQTASVQDCATADFYCRLTPFNPANLDTVKTLYNDLYAAYPDLDIIHGHDDGAMSDAEDCSPSALLAYAAQGFPSTCAELMAMDSDLTLSWAKLKSKTISEFFFNATADVRATNANIQLSRNFYVQVWLNPSSTAWLGQDCATALDYVDFAAPEVFPYMEGITPDSSQPSAEQYDFFFDDFLLAVQECNGAANVDKIQVCLQSVNWKQIESDGNYETIPSNQFEEWINYSLTSLFFFHIGFYPTNHFANQPVATSTLPSLLSIQNSCDYSPNLESLQCEGNSSSLTNHSLTRYDIFASDAQSLSEELDKIRQYAYDNGCFSSSSPYYPYYESTDSITMSLYIVDANVTGVCNETFFEQLHISVDDSSSIAFTVVDLQYPVDNCTGTYSTVDPYLLDCSQSICQVICGARIPCNATDECYNTYHCDFNAHSSTYQQCTDINAATGYFTHYSLLFLCTLFALTFAI